ncbi:PREDICTED: protocadherin-23-like [Thamnophis sirtalis]|uniref:Protocadherin-23-like n=1 Tax=Thamnophis sirtalis TaxID=35019 RepID=A0A6I9XMX3_9SAUR|nr:PREDICTED: protocadherin-23-like [Thamnophis sirtalis]
MIIRQSAIPEMEGGNTGGYFALHKTTGDLFTTRSLNRESVNNFTLVIECFDLGTPARSSAMELQIRVLDENDNSPLFTRNHYQAIISEDIEENSSILELFALDADEGPNGKVVYTLMDEPLGLFTINRTSGVVLTNKPMDRERQSQYIFKGIATDSDVRQPRSASVTIVVQIEDVNDNNPFFLENPLKLQVSFQTPINQAIATVQSRDLDLGLNGTVKFRFVTPATILEMDSNTGEIFLKEPVFYDGLFTHHLIMACDQGTPARTATAVVIISSKAHTEMISFSHTQYEAVVPENSEMGTSVFTVAAHDHSLMENNVKYTIISEHEDIFYIHPITGKITVKHPVFLDYEVRKEVHFSVLAENGMASAVCGVTVFLQDINDNAPQLIVQAADKGIPGLFANCTIDIEVVDINDNAPTLQPFDIIHLSESSLFLVKPLTYQFSHPEIHLLIEASDHGNPPLTAMTSVIVQIQAMNTYIPLFTMETYTFTISENASVGENLFTFSVNDQGRNHQGTNVVYSIIGGNNENKFYVKKLIFGPEYSDQTIGNLVLRNTLDREKCSSYKLLILASDPKAAHLNSTATVSITILDVNDNPPVFTSLEYHVHVREDVPVGSYITSVSAYDYDAGTNADVTYNIASGNDKGYFQLEGKTGSIHLIRALDYEAATGFNLTVQASDGGIVPKNVAFAVVFINVLDANDYVPVFVFPNLKCGVQENMPAFSSVCTISALDFDVGYLAYSIQSSCLPSHGNRGDRNLFIIDSLSGNIHTKQVLDFEHQIKYCFIAQAKDKSNSTATITVWINVEGLDELDPVFNQDEYFFYFPEKHEAGQWIGDVKASDCDGGVDGVIYYTLLGQSFFFSVNCSSGSVYLAGSIHKNRSSKKEKDGTFELLIKAHSPKQDSKSSTCTVMVNIFNSPETYPTLPAANLSVSIAISIIVLLFLAICLAVLIGRYILKDTCKYSLKKEMPCPSVIDLNMHRQKNSSKHFQEPQIHGTTILPLGSTADWLDLIGTRDKRNIDSFCVQSNSHSHGPIEEKIGENVELKTINEHLTRKGTRSALSDKCSFIPDSGISRDSDPFSCQSGENKIMYISQNTEALHYFRELLWNKMVSHTLAKVTVKEIEIMTDLTMEYIEAPGSKDLVTPLDSVKDLGENHNWNCLLNWEPSFKPLASVFSEIAELQDESIEIHNFPKGDKSFIFPPLLASTAQPDLKSYFSQLPTSLPDAF